MARGLAFALAFVSAPASAEQDISPALAKVVYHTAFFTGGRWREVPVRVELSPDALGKLVPARHGAYAMAGFECASVGADGHVGSCTVTVEPKGSGYEAVASAVERAITVAPAEVSSLQKDLRFLSIQVRLSNTEGNFSPGPCWPPSCVFTPAAPPAPPSSPPQPGGCGADPAALLALDIRLFDKTLGQGWRVVGDRPGCEAAGADLIASYRGRHAGELANGPVEDLAGLMRHESQLRAAAGEVGEAIRLRRNAVASGDQAQQLYDEATIAFLEKDRTKLEAIRRNLAALPKPVWFEAAAARAKAQNGLIVTWPPNLDVVEGFAACFDKPYLEAYSMTCRERGRGR